MNIRHGHASSRYDKSPKSLAEQVGRAVDSDRDGNLLTFTEVGSAKRAEKLKAEGWGRFVPHGKTDCGLMWDKAELGKVTTDVHRLTDKTWRDGQGNVHHQDATTVVLDSDAGRVWVSLIHLPSGVQDGDSFADDNDDNVASWKGATKGWAKYHKEHANDWHADLSLYVADWNVDFRSKHWRQHVGDLYPKCSGTWRKDHLPSDGTHGKRLIDATWTDGRFNWVGLLKDDPASSDHRPYGEQINWP